MESFGIKGIGLYFPNLWVDAVKLALKRGVSVEKITRGLGVYGFRIPDLFEDSVTMAASAALRAIENFSIEKEKIARVVVATETGIDRSKPISLFVHELLNLSSECEVFDVKLACVSGTIAIFDSIRWLKENSDKLALVIMSDISKYEKGTSAEFTQGAGSIAVILGKDPEMFEIHDDVIGIFTRGDKDFYKPPRFDHAFVYGKKSVENYLYSLKAVDDFINKLRKKKQSVCTPFSLFDAIVFHTPYPKLPLKAVKRLLNHYGINENHPVYEKFLNLTELSAAPASFVGNIYTGSVFLSFLGLLHGMIKKGENTDKKNIGFFSFGSGFSARFFKGRIVENSKELFLKIGLEKLLATKTEVSPEEYEEIFYKKTGVRNFSSTTHFVFKGRDTDNYPVYHSQNIENSNKTLQEDYSL